MASLFGSRSIQRAAPMPLVVDTTPCYLMAGVQSEICALTAKKVETPQTAEPAAAAAATEVEPQPYKFGDITRGVMKAAVKMKDQAQAQMAVVPLRPILAPLATPASQQQSTGGASSSGTDFLNAAVAKARTLSTENASGTSLLQQFTSTSSNANAVDRTSFMCFSDPSGLGNQAGCAAVAFGQPYGESQGPTTSPAHATHHPRPTTHEPPLRRRFTDHPLPIMIIVLRANTKGGSVLTSDAKNDTQSHTRYSWGGPDATLGSQLCPCSSAGKAQGAAVGVGDTVWLLTADMSQVLVFQQNSADGSLELVAVCEPSSRPAQMKELVPRRAIPATPPHPTPHHSVYLSTTLACRGRARDCLRASGPC